MSYTEHISDPLYSAKGSHSVLISVAVLVLTTTVSSVYRQVIRSFVSWPDRKFIPNHLNNNKVASLTVTYKHSRILLTSWWIYNEEVMTVKMLSTDPLGLPTSRHTCTFLKSFNQVIRKGSAKIIQTDCLIPSRWLGITRDLQLLNGRLGCQKQVSRAETNNNIPQTLWDVITCPYPWYLLLAHKSSTE